MIKINENNIVIETLNTTLIIEIKSFEDPHDSFELGRNFITLFYYGLKNNAPTFIPSKAKLSVSGSSNDFSYDLNMTNTFGDCNNVEGSLLISNVDGSYVNRFFYKDAEIINGEVDNKLPHSRDVLETLIIREEDPEAGLLLETYYSIFADSDVIAVKRKIINKNKKSIAIRGFSSLQLPLATKELSIFTYDGSWLYERTRHEAKLTSGTFINESVLFSSSHKHNPFIQIKNNDSKLVYSFNLIWSGDHKEFIDLDSVKQTALITVGLNSYTFDYEVKGGEEFITPEAIMSVSSSLEEGSKGMRSFVNNHIINPVWKTNRPILFNSWEGSAFNINDDKLFAMAEVCNKVGIELFVIDDGWFGARNNDRQGLGDWYVNKEKFPNGFGYTANKIREIGLDFGFWIEPEMIQLGSEIFKNKPEFACISKNRAPLQRRHQLNIDMSNPDVVDYLFDSLCKVIDETKPKYIKWDYNRNMSEAYSPYGTKSGELMYKYIAGSYLLMDKLTKKYPNLLFEGCSSGGGRFDLGIAYYMPQTWGSDDSNAYCRSFISCGTFAGYPQSMFGAHVSRDGCPLPGEEHFASLEDRFNLQCIGAFGYEFDVTKLPESDLEIIKNQVSFYKQYRNLIQFGNLEIIDNIFENKDYLSYQISNDDMSEIIFVVIQTRRGVASKSWKLKGLKEDKKFAISVRQHLNSADFKLKKTLYSGKELMEKGIKLSCLDKEILDQKISGIFSRLFVIKEVK